MPTESPRVQVEFTPEFKRVRTDIQPMIEQLEAGKFIGDQIRGTRHTVFKMRVRNSDIRRGKSAGYRLIYQVKAPTSVVLVTIYSKLDQGDIPAHRIRQILSEFEEHDG